MNDYKVKIQKLVLSLLKQGDTLMFDGYYPAEYNAYIPRPVNSYIKCTKGKLYLEEDVKWEDTAKLLLGLDECTGSDEIVKMLELEVEKIKPYDLYYISNGYYSKTKCHATCDGIFVGGGACHYCQCCVSIDETNNIVKCNNRRWDKFGSSKKIAEDELEKAIKRFEIAKNEKEYWYEIVNRIDEL